MNSQLYETMESNGAKTDAITHENKSWISLMDYLKALAICLVVTNHSLIGEARESWWFLFIVRMAVPIFVLVSGYNFTLSIERMSSPWQWYGQSRLYRKLRTYLLPMFAVFALWILWQVLRGHVDLLGYTKAFVLQSYGSGAYYFWLIVQLYLLFPVVYWLISKLKGGGILAVLLFNVAYEVVLYFVSIPQSVYRVIGLRYITMLALGSIIYRKFSEDESKSFHPALMVISFIMGCAYIAFFGMNNENREIFRYTSWGNTNVVSCLYIVPLFYLAVSLFSNKQLSPEWLHRLASAIGQSSYYILCTQMVMFWKVQQFWMWANVPLAVSTMCNIVISVSLGLCIQYLAKKMEIQSYNFIKSIR